MTECASRQELDTRPTLVFDRDFSGTVSGCYVHHRYRLHWQKEYRSEFPITTETVGHRPLCDLLLSDGTQQGLLHLTAELT